MTTLNYTKAITELKKHYEDNRLIPFIGAGFSMNLKLPDWKGLILSLGKNIGYHEELFLLHGSYQELAEYVKTYHKREWQEFIHTMHTDFDSDKTRKLRKTSKHHKALARLNFKTIYTTNYDLHIEESLRENKRNVRTIVILENFIEPIKVEDCTEVIKFHGCINYPDTIILTESQYFSRMALEEPVDQRLRSDLLSNSFLFLGYSFSDPNIRYIWYKIHALLEKQSVEKKAMRPSYVVSFGFDAVQAKLLNRWNIKLISLDPTKKEESLEQLLISLR